LIASFRRIEDNDRGRFYRTDKQEAAMLGAPFNWSLKTVPGAAHSDSRMSQAAADDIAKDSGSGGPLR